jgi:hypothetical protein
MGPEFAKEAVRMGVGKDTTKAKQIAQSGANRVGWIVRYIWT